MTKGDEVDAVRVAAVGDLHMRTRTRGRPRSGFENLPEHADLLLLAGDLTNRGRLSQAHALVDELGDLGLPIVAVLGNHDYDEGQESQIRALLAGCGIEVLDDGETALLEVRGIRVGVAGTVGYDGGFGTDFDLWWAVRVQKPADRRLAEAEHLGRALTGLREQGADLRIALTHYAPVLDTLAGERKRIIACLGNELLGRTIDAAGADLAVHGHAHFGTENGSTATGVPVRNVAQPVLGRPYAVYPLTPAPAHPDPAATAP